MSETTGTVGQVQSQAQDVASQATQKVQQGGQQAMEQARGQLQTQVDQRSTQAGEQVTSLAETIRSTGDQLREQGKSSHADIADRAASQIERVGSYLTRSDGQTLLDDVERFGRRQPMALALVGFGVGLMASRFLKASSERRYETSVGRWDSYAATDAAIREPSYGTVAPTAGGIPGTPAYPGGTDDAERWAGTPSTTAAI
jgi:hypothetical protein